MKKFSDNQLQAIEKPVIQCFVLAQPICQAGYPGYTIRGFVLGTGRLERLKLNLLPEETFEMEFGFEFRSIRPHVPLTGSKKPLAIAAEHAFAAKMALLLAVFCSFHSIVLSVSASISIYDELTENVSFPHRQFDQI